MSEAYLEVQVQFSTSAIRDKAVEFLNDEGPTFKDDVEDSYRHLFPLQDDIEQPEELHAIGQTRFFASFEVFGSDGLLRAEEYVEIFGQVGALDVYAFFTDDEGSEEGWLLKNGEIVTFYSGYEDDAEVAELLDDLDEPGRLSKLRELYQSGRLQEK